MLYCWNAYFAMAVDVVVVIVIDAVVSSAVINYSIKKHDPMSLPITPEIPTPATQSFATYGGTDENCMEIWFTASSSYMNDVSCTTVDPLVSCQRKPSKTHNRLLLLKQNNFIHKSMQS